MTKTAFFILLGLAAILVFSYFFFDWNSKDIANVPIPSISASISPESSPSPTDSNDGKVGEDIREFAVTGTSFKFTPAEIKVKLGEKVRIVFFNESGFHDWVLDEFNVRTKQMPAGQSEAIEFTADKKGTFEYYCSVGNHRQMGMVGKFIVE